MIQIIKDISKKYQATSEFIEVRNLETYFKARESFFKCYNEDRNLEIIIKNKLYFPYFLDLENYENIVSKEISEIEEPKIDLGSSENIFEFLLNSLNILTGTKKDLELLEKEYLQNYKFLFKEKEQNIDKFIETLVKIVVFSNYRECNFNILLDSNFTKEMYLIAKDDTKLKENYIKEKEKLIKYLEICNKTLFENSRKIQLFNEIPTEKYLFEINGELEFEENYFLEKTIERLNQLTEYEDIKSNLLKAQKVFNKNYSLVIELIDALILLEKNRKIQKNTLNDFKEYFTEIYLNYNNILANKNIESNINEIEKQYKINLSSLKRSIKNIWRDINQLFEEFYLKNYSNLYSSFEQKGIDYAIENSLPLLNNKKKNLYIFIDCLRFDIWLGIKKYLQEKEWNCHLEKIVLSAIPTVTSYCKKILYTGKKFNQIENKEYFKVDIENITDIQDIESLTSQNLLYEISDLDALFHNIKDLTGEWLQTFIESKLDKILSLISKEEYNIIIMTDHGAMKLDEDGFSSFNNFKNILTEKGLEIENHGRYIKVYSSFFDDELYESLNNYLQNTDDFYVIDRKNMSKYYLPLAENNAENYFYLIYKYGKYPKKSSEYNHGGISLEEVFIPYTVLKSEVREFISIDLEIKTLEIKNSSNSEVTILIKNSNILQSLKLNLKYQNFIKEYSEVEGNKLIQIPLKLDETFEGEFRDIIDIEYCFDNEKKNIKFPLVVNILKSQKATINKKLKQSRALL